jgi:hypothetical protein
VVSTQVLLQPAGEPLTLTEAKLAARVDPDITADDDYIADLITKARVFIEDTLAIALISRTVLISWDRFPRQGDVDYIGEGLWNQPGGDQRIPTTDLSALQWSDRVSFRLPISPLQEVQALQYTDVDDTLMTLAAADYRIDRTSDPPRIAPSFGNVWPPQLQQSQAVSCRSIVGYGPSTTIASAITTTGSQAVTPASMYGIYAQDLTSNPINPGTVLMIDTGQKRELVTVTAATASTFTATFTKTHAAGVTVRGGIPETIRGYMRMLVAHWIQNREPVIPGTYTYMPLAADALRAAIWNGELR